MEHSFDIDAAKEYGVIPAILLRHIEYWLAKNEANQRHFYDGCYWTYCSVSAFTEIFPYLSADQIRHALKKLIDSEIIKTGHYSKNDCNRTTWYAFGDKYPKVILEKSQMDSGKIPNVSGKNPKSYSSTYNNNNIYNTDKRNTDKEKETNVSKKKVPDGTVLAGFVKPSVEEVAAYISEKGYSVDAEEIVDYYTSNGWKVGKNPMKDWKAAVRNWVRREEKKAQQKPTQTAYPKLN